MSSMLILGTIINPLPNGKVQYFQSGAMLLKGKKVRGSMQYKIVDIGPKSKIKAPQNTEVLDYSKSIIMPGFYDMHFHWVQDDVRLMPKASLLTWLKKYTFPTEEMFANSKFAKQKAEKFFTYLTKAGTVGGACYSSIHSKALDYAFNQARGQFVIGNVTMTINSPKALTQSRKAAIELVVKALKKYGKQYAFTPRFAIATDHETMTEGSRLTKKKGAFIQTHLSENEEEISTVMNIYRDIPGFEKVGSYTEIYQKCGVLGPKTIMGHGIHLSAKELQILSQTKTTIAHCPTSNAPVRQKGLGSGLFDFKKVERAGVRWALASDIGGGPFVSMFDVMRSFVTQNRARGVKGATCSKALYHATLAGAEILGLDKDYGNLSKGKFADFIVVSNPSKKGLPRSVEQLLEQMIFLHENKRKNYDTMVSHVYLKGIEQ